MSEYMPNLREQLRERVCRAAKEMHASKLVAVTGGNVSARLAAAEFLITPSALPYEQMRPADIVLIDAAGERLDGSLPPSSERRMHLAIYRKRPDIGGIVHTHSPYATALAVAGRRIPALLPEAVIAVGGDVPLAPYARPGTWELGETVAEYLAKRNAVLMEAHGLVAVGANVEAALETAIVVEETARIYWLALQVGTVRELDPAEVKAIIETHGPEIARE